MVAARLGASHSARVIVMSLDQADFVSRAPQADAQEIGRFLIERVARLEAAGADFFLICAPSSSRTACRPRVASSS